MWERGPQQPSPPVVQGSQLTEQPVSQQTSSCENQRFQPRSPPPQSLLPHRRLPMQQSPQSSEEMTVGLLCTAVGALGMNSPWALGIGLGSGSSEMMMTGLG